MDCDASHGQAVKTVAYLRVSTAQQDLRRQRLAILKYARKHDFRIDDFIEVTVAGQASEKRRRLDELMNVLQRDIQTKVMTTLFALFAEVERDLIAKLTGVSRTTLYSFMRT